MAIYMCRQCFGAGLFSSKPKNVIPSESSSFSSARPFCESPFCGWPFQCVSIGMDTTGRWPSGSLLLQNSADLLTLSRCDPLDFLLYCSTIDATLLSGER